MIMFLTIDMNMAPVIGELSPRYGSRSCLSVGRLTCCLVGDGSLARVFCRCFAGKTAMHLPRILLECCQPRANLSEISGWCVVWIMVSGFTAKFVVGKGDLSVVFVGGLVDGGEDCCLVACCVERRCGGREEQ